MVEHYLNRILSVEVSHWQKGIPLVSNTQKILITYFLVSHHCWYLELFFEYGRLTVEQLQSTDIAGTELEV